MLRSALVFVLVSSFTHSLAAEKTCTSGLNPEFVECIEQRTGPGWTPHRCYGHALGGIPCPADLSHMKGARISVPGRQRAYPARYDLRDENRLPPVRNQGNYPTCWAHGSLGSLESCLMPGTTNDFSENNVANLSGWSIGFNMGGNNQMTSAYLTRWDGPVREDQDPYPAPGLSPSNIPPSYHVQKILSVPDRASPTDNDNIKMAIMDHGAVCSYMQFLVGCYSNTTYALYCPASSNDTAIGHYLDLAGWDDDFSITNFHIKPPGDGAFICRNSWGTNFADAGYFYISYYDAHVAKYMYVYDQVETVSNYSRAYIHDWLGHFTFIGFGSDTAWEANVFTPTNRECVKAVGFWTATPDTTYEIGVYNHLTTGNPTNGALRTTESGTLAWPGYHTVPLSSGMTVRPGHDFSVQIKLTSPGTDNPLAVQFRYTNYTDNCTAHSGYGYVSTNGSDWQDATLCLPEVGTNIKVSVRAYTVLDVENDYNRDGNCDIAVYHNQTGNWFINTTNGNVSAWNWGGPGLEPVRGDYNGDGYTDLAVYDSALGTWYIRDSCSTTAIVQGVVWGGPAMDPVAGDYDGDGTSDLAVYDRTSGNWYIATPGGDIIAWALNLGDKNMVAMPGDYNGDGKSDPAVYNESNGEWYICSIENGVCGSKLVWGFQFGSGEMCAVPGDYDGDGTHDLSVFDSTGHWYILSLDGNVIAWGDQWGYAGVTPVPGDYNGDNACDQAVYDETTGLWYIKTADNTLLHWALQWGGAGFVPVQ